MPTCPAGHHIETDRLLVYCPICGQKMPLRDQVVCPNGHVVAGHHRFCPECGIQLKSARPVWLTAGILAIVLFVLLYLLFPPAQIADSIINGLQTAIDWVSGFLSKMDIPGL